MKLKSWKTWFYLLLGINLIILLFLGITLFGPTKDPEFKTNNEIFQGYVPFLIHTEKENLNEVINHYINKEATGAPIQYRVNLADEVELYGTIIIFGEELQMKMTFIPEARRNGDLVLQQKSITLGQLKLPVTYILKFIEERYRLPKGVIIQPSKKLVYISMQDLKLKSGFKVKVNKFDLEKNDISVQLLVPTK